MKSIKYVVYYRVSTKRQGESGLGLEAQKRDVEIFLNQYSDHPFEIIDTITDIKSGKGKIDDRPELKRAVELAIENKATLLVAKLDRLGRSVALISSLVEKFGEKKGSDLRVACMPHADKLQLHIYAALAEQEREFISQRTKAALKAAKARGVALGGLRPGTKARNEGAKQAANDRAEKLRPEFELMMKHDYTLKQIADSLNARNITTPKGGKWQATQVKRIIDRLN